MHDDARANDARDGRVDKSCMYDEIREMSCLFLAGIGKMRKGRTGTHRLVGDGTQRSFGHVRDR
jgi:hypothetical protein